MLPSPFSPASLSTQRAAAVRSPYIATLVLVSGVWDVGWLHEFLPAQADSHVGPDQLALFAVLVIILNLYALFLVKIMRKHVLNRARRLSHEEAPQAASVHPQGISIVRADSAESPAAATAATPASLPLKSTPHQFSPTNTVDSTACDNDATLQRVSRDMTFAVPITIAMTIGLGICAVAGARLSNKLSAWSFYEFVSDFDDRVLVRVDGSIVVCLFACLSNHPLSADHHTDGPASASTFPPVPQPSSCTPC